MLYCENCKRVCVSERDCICGSDELREVTAQDYCYLLEVDETLARMFEEGFASDGIACVLVPSGNGCRSAFGLSLGNFIMFVQYRHYEQAKDAVDQYFQSIVDGIKSDLIEHRDRWNANKKTQKKLRKKLKLADGEDFFDGIYNFLCNAESVSDDGVITTSEDFGHYISVRSEKVSFWFNSATYEVFI